MTTHVMRNMMRSFGVTLAPNEVKTRNVAVGFVDGDASVPTRPG